MTPARARVPTPMSVPRSIEKVLMVDDEPHVRRVAELSLARVGKWAVSLAASGVEALVAAERDRPDLILLDVMMPGMDGPTTLTALQTQGAARRIPVIFMTAKVQDREIERYLGLGAAGGDQEALRSDEASGADPPDHVRAVPDGVSDGEDEAEALRRALAEVRAEYAAELPALVEALAVLVVEAAGRPEAVGVARSAAHRLRGTAGSYGFAALGEAAGRIEDALDEGMRGAELVALVAALRRLKL